MVRAAAAHVWLDGTLVPSDVAHVSVYDRGFQLGDGVFEALRAKRGVAIELAGHLARLRDSMGAMGYELPFTDDQIGGGIRELLAAEGLDGVEPLDDGSERSQSGGDGTTTRRGSGYRGAPSVEGAHRPGDAVVRITVSRGFDPARGVRPSPGLTASAAIQTWPFSSPSARVLSEGERFVTSRIHRDADSPMSGIKTTSRAELVFARLEAERAGADDAIFLTTDGRITEATTSNLLLISGTTCATPRLGTGLLAGTTRAWLVEHGEAAGLSMVQRDLTLDDALRADEMAICSSIGGVIPVTSLDGRPIGDGRPGPRTMALRQARESYIDRLSIEGARARLALP